MNWLQDVVSKRANLIIGFVIVLTIIFGYSALDIGIDTDVKEMFPEGHPALENFDRVSEDYGGVEYIFIMFSDDDVITPGTLSNIEQMTEQLKELEDISEVNSITNIEEVRGDGLTIEVEEYIERIPEKEAELASLREDLKTRD